jgi:hypothetical protein
MRLPVRALLALALAAAAAAPAAAQVTELRAGAFSTTIDRFKPYIESRRHLRPSG